MHFSIDGTVHTTAFDKPVVDHWLERKIAQTAAGSTEKDRSDDRPLQRRARYRLSYIPLPTNSKCIFCTGMSIRKEMFYLTMHSTHFIYSYMVKDHSYSERGNLLPHGLLFPISSKDSFICIIPQIGKHIPRPSLHQMECQ